MIIYPFQPAAASGVVAAPNAAAVAVAVKAGCRQVMVSNRVAAAGTIIYWRGDGVAATAADAPIFPQQSRVFTKDGDALAGSIFCAGVGDAHVISGNGN